MRAALVMTMLLLMAGYAAAHDDGQWQNSDPVIKKWFDTLMQPDNPRASCCNVADAYWADEIHVRDGKTYARITDDRPDEPRGRPHRNIGEEFEIPDAKLKYDRGNPTGHTLIFLSRDGFVWCFVQGSGI